MDNLSIFAGETPEVTITGNAFKEANERLEHILEQLKMTHLGNELYHWGNQVEAEDV